MTEKQKKVIAGLEACLSDEHRHKANNIDHGDCPYRHIPVGCIVGLHKDVYEVLCDELGMGTKKNIENTFPDCPTCGNMKNGDCNLKDSCIVELSQDSECRIGNPSNWIPMNENCYEIKEMMPNGDGSYYVVVNGKTPDGLTVRMDIPSATFEDVSLYEDLIVDEIVKLPSVSKECLMQYEVENE